ncbi:MAG: hypothetical protein Q7S87_09075 [Agitococcus sp.]|nr:hypothetical protein [Agitococcus sp.]MDO9177053.1 hypothetical protein [Agitococcus sp.]
MQNQSQSHASQQQFIVVVEDEKVLIAKESDFSFFLRQASVSKIESLKKVLHANLKTLGEQRNPTVDLLRMRLKQARSCLQAV